MSALHSNASSPILITSGSSDHSDPAIWVTSSPRADFSGAGTSRSGLLGPPRFPNPTTFAPHLPVMPYNRDHEFDEMRNECHQLRQRVTRLETNLARSQGNVFTLTYVYLDLITYANYSTGPPTIILSIISAKNLTLRRPTSRRWSIGSRPVTRLPAPFPTFP
jgi:hypothetical protein